MVRGENVREKLRNAAIEQIMRITRESVLIDKTELERRAWYWTKERADTSLSNQDGWKFIAKTIKELCHGGELGVLFKRTKKGNKSYLVHEVALYSNILERLEKLVNALNKRTCESENEPLTRKLMDLLVYLGEVTVTDDEARPVV